MDAPEDHLDEEVSDDELASQPHDAFFKEVFSDIERATGFFQEHLPAPLAAHIDWPTLTLIKGSFVRDNLQQLHSDLLFNARALGRDMLLHFLFEHQTTVDPGLRLRLHGYKNEIWRRHMENHGLPLPPIIPVVLHQGPDRWHVSTRFEDLFDLPSPLADLCAPYLPKYEHLLLDLTQYEPASEEKHEINRLLLECMKQARAKKVLEFLLWMTTQRPRTVDDLVRLCMLYLWNTDRGLDPEAIKSHLPESYAKEQIMTIAAKINAEGQAQGRLKLLQELMGLPVSSDEDLAGIDLPELQRRFQLLQQQYAAQFKGSPGGH